MPFSKQGHFIESKFLFCFWEYDLCRAGTGHIWNLHCCKRTSLQLAPLLSAFLPSALYFLQISLFGVSQLRNSFVSSFKRSSRMTLLRKALQPPQMNHFRQVNFEFLTYWPIWAISGLRDIGNIWVDHYNFHFEFQASFNIMISAGLLSHLTLNWNRHFLLCCFHLWAFALSQNRFRFWFLYWISCWIFSCLLRFQIWLI